MKKAYSLLFLILGVLILLPASCTKDKESTTKTKTELLCLAPWKVSSANEVTVATGKKSPMTLDPCEMDNLATFYSNKTYITSTGKTKCYTGEKDETGTWAFNANETSIISDSTDEVMIILELSESTLKIKTDTYSGIYLEQIWVH